MIAPFDDVFVPVVSGTGVADVDVVAELDTEVCDEVVRGPFPLDEHDARPPTATTAPTALTATTQRLTAYPLVV